MKTISDYTIYCTEVQTKKAFELGAPIEYANIADLRANRFVNSDIESYALPTAEQMLGWLDEQEGIKDIVIAKPHHWVYLIYNDVAYHSFESKALVIGTAIESEVENYIKETHANAVRIRVEIQAIEPKY